MVAAQRQGADPLGNERFGTASMLRDDPQRRRQVFLVRTHWARDFRYPAARAWASVQNISSARVSA